MSDFAAWDVELHGHRMVYRVAGDGPPIVLIHGMVNNSRHWRSVALTLADRYTVIAPDPPLYPSDRAGEVREAEAWGDGELQNLGRRLPWGALHFRPEAMGTFGGAEPLDGPGTDFAIKLIRGTWKYHGLSAELIEKDLAGLPAKLDHIDALAADGVIGTEEATAADLQIGATIRVLMVVEDLLPLIEGRPAEEVARRWFPDYTGSVPAGAFPAGWVPSR